jgi:RNA polymerase sigma-70 factor, ECF subfamily
VDLATNTDFTSLYEEHADRLWRSLFAYTGVREVANDAVSEAFTQCMQRGNAVRSPSSWVWKAAFKIAAGEMSERRRFEPIASDPGYELPPTLWELLSSLAMLPTRQRAVLVLFYYADFPVREIASILGIGPATVRVHLSHGRKRLHELMELDDERPA